MFCIVAFVVLSILGIFSASNRQLARESFDCVFRRVTFRPCNTGFDEKMKAKILGVVITRSESAARFLNRNFELLSWIFFILLLASSIYSMRSVYLYYVTGSCNGLNQTAFCVFDPTGANNQVSSDALTCQANAALGLELTLADTNLTGFPVQNPDSPDRLVMIGSYGCDFTRKAYPTIQKLVERFQPSFTFLHYPVKEKSDYLARVGYCVQQQDEAKFWQLNDILLTTDKANLEDAAFLQQTLSELGVSMGRFQFCVSDPQTQQAVQARLDEIAKTNFYGTPTVFAGGEALVGPKPYRVYAIPLKGLLYWLVK